MARNSFGIICVVFALGCCARVDPGQPPTCDGHSFIDLAVNAPACEPQSTCAFDANYRQIEPSDPRAAFQFACVDGRYDGHATDAAGLK